MDLFIMTTPNDYQPTLLPSVIALLDKRRGTWREVCADTGVNYSTLQKIVQGQVTNPGVNTVERLHEYLVANQGEETAA